MRRQYGPGNHEAPCGAPQDLGELSHGLALNPLPVAAEGHQGTRGGCQPQMSIRHTPDALHFCAFGNSAGKHLGMLGGTVPGKNSREKTFLLGCAGSVEPLRWRGLGCALEASLEAGRQGACPALLPISCQAPIAWLLALHWLAVPPSPPNSS